VGKLEKRSLCVIRKSALIIAVNAWELVTLNKDLHLLGALDKTKAPH
jgi:hypothetical protein